VFKKTVPDTSSSDWKSSVVDGRQLGAATDGFRGGAGAKGLCPPRCQSRPFPLHMQCVTNLCSKTNKNLYSIYAF